MFLALPCKARIRDERYEQGESMLSRRAFFFLTLILVLALAVTATLAQTGDPGERVLIRTAKPYDALVASIQSLGGRVTYQYKYVDAIAAEVPRKVLASLREKIGVGNITKDEIIPLPISVDTLGGRNLTPSNAANEITADSFSALDAVDIQSIATVNPNMWLTNLGVANVASLHASGITGAGVIVAVIDSGIRPGFLDDSLIGCEDFAGDGLGCSNSANISHGTGVALAITENVVVTFSPASAFRNAVLAECPSCFLDPPTNTQIPMIGTAPLSSIYALRTVGPTSPSPLSRTLAAVERLIELRQKFDAGKPGGVNIQVANMSFGLSTIFAGRDLFDTTVDALLNAGIVTTIAAANDGPSSLTVSSPGTSRNVITVGAASLPQNERILRRVQFGPSVGPLWRPFLGVQTAWFSSRGPDANGLSHPDLTASGFADIGRGSGTVNQIGFSSGTSISAPSVAGVAALLRQAFPGATASQIRNAIIASANSGLLSDGSTVLDQGAGYVNGAGAASLIASGGASSAFPTLPNSNKSVKVNVEQGSFLRVRNGFITDHFAGLKPAERHEIVYNVTPNTSQVIVVLSNVTPALSSALQNQLFGDHVFLAVHSAKTSVLFPAGDYPVLEHTPGGTFVIHDPEPGLMRITVNGSWTNAGTISGDVAILSLTDPVPQFTTQGKISDQELLSFPVNVPAGVSQADFRLGWRQDWGNYPTADVDLILIAPNGSVNFAGATLNNPEHAVINDPLPGTWFAIVSGFEIQTGTDKFELRVALDGKVVK
jgi:subtilisin family serine protease